MRTAIVSVLAPNGDTPLHLAMKLSDENRCFVITKILVEAGCSPCERDADDKPPVHIAVVRGFISVVEYLLSQDAPLPSRILFTALQTTLPKRVETIRLLTRKGANVHVLSPDGHPLLHVAMWSPDRIILPEITQILVDAGCKPLAFGLDVKTLQGYHELGNYLLLFGRSSDVLPLLDPNPTTQALALHSLIRNVDGLRRMVKEGDGLLQVVSQCLDDEEQHLALAKKFVAAQSGPSSGGTNLFNSAVRRGFWPVMEFLVCQCVPLPRGILFTALRYQVSMVPFLVRKGASVHVREDTGDTLLHVAMSISEETQCHMTVQVLVQAGCPISISNTAGRRPIHIAVSQGFIPVVKYLMSLAPHDGLPLDLLASVSLRRNSSSMVRLLVDHGANTTHVDLAGNGLLHHVMQFSDEEECLEATQVLVQAGCHHFALNDSRETPLHAAVKRGFVSVVDYLISNDVPIQLPPDILSFVAIGRPLFDLNSGVLSFVAIGKPWFGFNSGGSSRVYEGLCKWKEMVASLIRGANPRTREVNEGTLVHYTIDIRLLSETECLKVIRVLVEAGCRTSVPNADGTLPIQIAVARGLPSIVEYLLSHHTPVPPDILLTAVKAQHATSHWHLPRMITLLVQNGADVSVCAANGDSILHVASAWGKYWLHVDPLLEVVKILVMEGCDPCVLNSKGHTPLEVAVAMGYAEVLDYLHMYLLRRFSSESRRA